MAAGEANQAVAATAAVEGVAGSLLGEVANEHDRGRMPLGEDGERYQLLADGLVAVGVDAGLEEGEQRIYDQEACASAADEAGKWAQVTRDAEDIVAGACGQIGNRGDARQVGAGGFQSRADGLGEAVFGREQYDGGRDTGTRGRGARSFDRLRTSGLLVGHGAGGGEAGGEVEQEE